MELRLFRDSGIHTQYKSLNMFVRNSDKAHC